MLQTDLLIIGGSGFIGARAAQSALRGGQSAACTYRSRPVPPGIPAYPLDLGDPAALRALLEQTQPRAVVYSVLSWDLASEERQMTASAGHLGLLIDALADLRLPARLVYISTNAVFSGQRGPSGEDDLPDPELRWDAYRFYGMARRAGERLALERWPETIVARTANVDGRDAWGALNQRLVSLIEPLRAGQPLPRFVDRILSPTLVDSIADGLVEISAPGFALPPGRVLHIAGSEPVSDYQYARRLAARLGADPALVREDHYLPPGATGEYNIALDTRYTQSLLTTRLVGVEGLLAALFPVSHPPAP